MTHPEDDKKGVDRECEFPPTVEKKIENLCTCLILLLLLLVLDIIALQRYNSMRFLFNGAYQNLCTSVFFL
jgi:hypothetical protein